MDKKITDEELGDAILDIVKQTSIENAIKGEPVYTIVDMLTIKNITALKALAKLYRISGYKKMNKVELIDKIHSAVLNVERLCEFLYVIDDDEWNFFQRVLAEKHIQDDKIYVTSFHFLQLAGYLQCYYYNDKLYFVVPEEVKKLLLTVKDTDFYENKGFYSLINAYAKASTNLYGIISMDDFVELFNSQNSRKTNVDEIFPILLKYIHVDVGYCFYDEYIVNDNFEENDFKDVLPLGRVIEKKPRYTPAKSDFLKYADYDYFEMTHQLLALKGYIIKNLTDDPEMAEDIIFDIHDLCMQEARPQAILDVFEEYEIVFDGFEQVQQIIKLVTDVSNNTRLWLNHGHTPNELFERDDRPKLKQLSKESFRVVPQKISPNQFCPCGSGKKYKKCCGK